MAIISLDIPDGALPRIRDAFCAEFNYQEIIREGNGNLIPNPQTKAQFTKAQIIEYVKQVTKNYEANIAAQSARTTKNSEIEAISIT